MCLKALPTHFCPICYHSFATPILAILDYFLFCNSALLSYSYLARYCFSKKAFHIPSLTPLLFTDTNRNCLKSLLLGSFWESLLTTPPLSPGRLTCLHYVLPQHPPHPSILPLMLVIVTGLRWIKYS